LDSIITRFLQARWKTNHPPPFLTKHEQVEIHLDWSDVEIKNDPVVYTEARGNLHKAPKTQTLFSTRFENQTELEQE
jgi:hypothetical protein